MQSRALLCNSSIFPLFRILILKYLVSCRHLRSCIFKVYRIFLKPSSSTFLALPWPLNLSLHHWLLVSSPEWPQQETGLVVRSIESSQLEGPLESLTLHWEHPTEVFLLCWGALVMPQIDSGINEDRSFLRVCLNQMPEDRCTGIKGACERQWVSASRYSGISLWVQELWGLGGHSLTLLEDSQEFQGPPHS